MTDQGWTVRPGPVPALLWPDDENPDMPFSLTEGDLAEMLPDALDRQVEGAFAALRDALARDAQAQKAAADVVWMAKLARGGSWPGGMAQAVDSAAERVIRALGTDDDRAALDAVTAALYPSPGDRGDSEEQK